MKKAPKRNKKEKKKKKPKGKKTKTSGKGTEIVRKKRENKGVGGCCLVTPILR